jgi:hypothetical protein
VLNLFETQLIELYHLTNVTADGRRERLGTTGNHPFYEASERRFVPARELRPGCRVVTVTGAIAEVEAAEVHTAAAGESFTTYNIEVEEDHTSHVGEPGTWVHNESAERCLELAREAADGSEEAVGELRRIFSKAPKLRRSIDGQLREIVDSDLLRRIDAPNSLPRPGIDVGEYRVVGGHHVHAKAGFKGHGTYDLGQGFSISQDYMKSRGWNHQDTTNKQRELFGELARSGRTNSLAEHTRIAEEAFVAGGATRAEAQALVQSLQDLAQQGVIAPTRIPWQKSRR